MKVLLINPPGEMVRETCCEGPGPSSPPYGLSLIAGKLKGKHELYGLDARVNNLSLEEVKKEIKKISPDVVICSVVSTNFGEDIKVLKISKKFGCMTIMVMDLPIFQEEIMKDYNFIDISVLRERETTIDNILSGEKLNNVKGIIYRNKKKIVKTGEPEYVDYSTLPMPFFEIFYDNPNYECYRMISSRYCSFNCDFCFWSNRPWSGRTAKQLCDELEYYFSVYKNARFVFFVDQLFTMSRERVLEFCEEIKKRRLKFEWSCDSRVDTINEELLERMHEAGCRRIFYGVESIQQELLEGMNKKIKIGDVKNKISLTKKHGIKAVVSFIIGYPGDTEETIKNIEKFIIETLPDHFHINFLRPYPETVIYEKCKKNNFITTKNYKEYLDWACSGYVKNQCLVSYKNLTKEKLEQLRKEMLLRLLLNPHYMFKFISDIPIKKIPNMFVKLIRFSTK